VQRDARLPDEVSKPDKVLFEDDGITKLDLATYYAAVAPAMVPLIDGRPLNLERFPDGLGG
jgi:bifunctional non-homologous end joining protein LigD